MSIYKPTWLYIKKHNKTGLKYFGKTVSKDPIKYTGSGKYWKMHLNKHGEDITTLWCHLYYDKKTLIEDAVMFSEYHDIVNSNEWANLKPETGIDGGGIIGRIISEETKKKISNANKGRKMSREFRQMRSELQKGKIPWNKGMNGSYTSPKKGKKFNPLTIGHKEKISNTLKGRPKPPRTKEHSENISKGKIGKSGHPHTETAKIKISMSHAGRRKMYNDNLNIPFKMVPFDKIEEYLLNGWKFSRNKK